MVLFMPILAFTWQTVVPDSIRETKVAMNDDFFQAVELFLNCSESLRQSELYRNDAIEFAAFYLGAKADLLYVKALEMKKKGNKTEADRKLAQTVSLLLNADRLLLSHPLHRLDRWIEQARDCGVSAMDCERYEMNAKRLITDVGRKTGRLRCSCVVRFDKRLLYTSFATYFSDQSLGEWEENWIVTPWRNTTQTFRNPLKAAVRLVKEASAL